MDPDRRELLKEEYFAIQKFIEEFDARALTIKAWSVTLSAAGIVTAYIQSEARVLLIAAGSALVFWIVEALWKTNQQAFYDRSREIERFFAGREGDLPPLQITTSWSSSWRRRGGAAHAFRVMAWPHVYMPHLVVAAAGLALYLFAPPLPA